MKVQWICYLHPYTSMGVIAINVVKELIKLGIDVGIHTLNPQDINLQDYSKEIQKAIQKPIDFNSIGIFFSYPNVYGNVRYKVNIGYTGADSSGWYKSGSDKTPSQICNSLMDYMLTPSKYSKEIMKNCGVNIPIEIFPHGIDPEIFKPKQKIETDLTTFLYCGELSKRKGSQDLIECFIDLYGNNNDYKLILRSNTHMKFYDGNEIKDLVNSVNNIDIIWENKGQQDIKDYYNVSDFYIYPSRADWFGMTVLEALACGLPTAATCTNGYYEFFSNELYPILYELKEIKNEHPYLLGNWSCVNKDDLKNKMKMFVKNKKELKDISLKISENIRKKFSWEEVTNNYLLPFLEKVEKEQFKKEIDVKRIICGYP